MHMSDMIIKKRNGEKHTKEEIEYIVNGITDGSIPDYQITAWMMAIYFNGMDDEETTNLTVAMAKSGEMADMTPLAEKGIVLDRHSTGGVGDKNTPAATPIVAAAGVLMPVMSGKGLAHCFGSVDKLEAIPGLRCEYSTDEFINIVENVGCAVVGQSEKLDPADKIMFALRDVSGTVECMPLIASSIMSKKVACDTRLLLIDVKTGKGAFMREYSDAVKLAQILVSIGENAGIATYTIVTNMDTPIGVAVGNGLEAVETMEILKGGSPKDAADFVKRTAAYMMEICGLGSEIECTAKVDEIIGSGKAIAKFKEMIAAQGGDERVVDDYSLMGSCEKTVPVLAEQSGYIAEADALEIGCAAAQIGAGRFSKDDQIDYMAGIKLYKKTGCYVEKGELIAEIFSNKDDETINSAIRRILGAIKYSDKEPQPYKQILAYVNKNGVFEV